MDKICIAVSRADSFLQLLGLLLIFILVLAATYYVTKWIAGFEKSQSFNHNLHVVETLKITTNKYIQIVKAGNKYLVIAVGKDEITMLAELDKDEVEEEFAVSPTPFNGESFKQIFDKIKNKLPDKRDDDEVGKD
ncbi:MAG: flagellar biosynthetic protein FliO [Lachnospiraceae bacterium]|nr:flagellar biosynthetic protein FliO [Lachnospiraceae bacterium]